MKNFYIMDFDTEKSFKTMNEIQTTIQGTITEYERLQTKYATDATVQRELAILEKHKTRLLAVLAQLEAIRIDTVPPVEVVLPVDAAPLAEELAG